MKSVYVLKVLASSAAAIAFAIAGVVAATVHEDAEAAVAPMSAPPQVFDQAVSPVSAKVILGVSQTSLGWYVSQCAQRVRELFRVVVVLSARGKVQAALGIGACSAVAGAWLGTISVSVICRSSWFWGPFGAASRRLVSLLTDGHYSRC